MVNAHSLRLIEAILFASAEPLSESELGERLPEGEEIGPVIERIAELYAGRGVNLVRVGERWALRTAPDLAPRLRAEARVERRLSRAAIETLAIIAYHQPVTRAEIEEIRGVMISRGTLDILLEAGWIRPKGRRQTPGRPVTWATTDSFLDHFGLERLDDLPGIEELKASGLLQSGPSIVEFARADLPPRGPEGEDGGEEERAVEAPTFGIVESTSPEEDRGDKG
jgi:segregation and condensation protein B